MSLCILYHALAFYIMHGGHTLGLHTKDLRGNPKTRVSLDQTGADRNRSGIGPVWSSQTGVGALKFTFFGFGPGRGKMLWGTTSTSYTLCTLCSWCSQTELTILKISIRWIYALIGLIHLLLGQLYFDGNI